MKTVFKHILSSFLFLLLMRNADAQTKTDIIKTIRKDFKSINAEPALERLTLREEEFLEETPDGGGELTGYFKGNKLVKIIESIGVSYGNRTREFYFKNDELFFVYERFDAFIQTKNSEELDYTRTTVSFEGRFYFNKKALIEQKLTGKEIIEQEFKDVAKELVENAAENRKILLAKKQRRR